ncbi:hypothetical protein [Halapricum desulfuricans]|uniref:Uncharacterized protein n=1 Tax=Halapricum desulfuricans TaxID=2841257 RepID=A0A897NBY6_9EURY|nr:hypothetical protein [Halapricum desulfuricans]QSG09901.1 hypothetical protein HSR122_2525 [Halapricum desulfuricans]
MATGTQDQSWFARNPWWRNAVSITLGIVGTAVLLVIVSRIPPVVNSWEPLVGGHLTREYSYDQFNTIWLAVRAMMGLYISFVLLIIAGQLLGHWRRYVVEAGENL